MWIIRIALVIGVLGALVLTEETDYEYEDAPEPAPPKKPVALSPRGGRPSILPGKANKIPTSPIKSAAKPAAKPVEPEPPLEEGEEEAYEEGDAAEQPAEETSTEPPRKTIKPVVRPFRSNEDLLAALKRRRQQASQIGSAVERTTSAPNSSTEGAPAKKSPNNLNKSPSSRRGRVNQTPTVETPSVSPRKPSSSGRRSSRPSPPAEEEVVEEVKASPPATRPTFNRGPKRS